MRTKNRYTDRPHIAHADALRIAALVLLAAMVGASPAAPADRPATRLVQAPAGQAEAAATRAVIESLQQELLNYMRQANAGDGPTEAAVASLQEAILATHDFPYIARIVLGRHWRSLSQTRQEAFTQAFTALSLATYANRFADFDGEVFRIEGTAESLLGQRQVTATLVTDDGEHSFEYLLRQDGEGTWRIVNIIVDGVSDLALKRAEYATLFGEEGYEGLMESLAAQRRKLADS